MSKNGITQLTEPVKVQSAETILTDEQKAQFVTDIINYGTGFTTPLFAVVESIEQAVLQSPEIQALKKDAQRYRWLRDSGNDDIGVVSGLGCTDSGSSNVVGTYEYILDGEQLDSVIDRASHTWEKGNKCL